MNAKTPAPSFDTEQRARLASLADVLMPAGEGLPAPSDIEVQGLWLDQAVAALPAMAEALPAVLAMPGSPSEVIQRLQAEQPQVFVAFSFLVSGAYLMHPHVRHALGYEGPAVQPNPPLEGETEYYLEDGLLDPVIARGPIYRAIPK